MPNRLAKCFCTAFLFFFTCCGSYLLVQISFCFQPPWLYNFIRYREKILLHFSILLVFCSCRFAIVRFGCKIGLTFFENFDFGIRVLDFGFAELVDLLAKEDLWNFLLRLPKVITDVYVDILVWANEFVHC